jgi:hypothetical protein
MVMAATLLAVKVTLCYKTVVYAKLYAKYEANAQGTVC